MTLLWCVPQYSIFFIKILSKKREIRDEICPHLPSRYWFYSLVPTPNWDVIISLVPWVNRFANLTWVSKLTCVTICNISKINYKSNSGIIIIHVSNWSCIIWENNRKRSCTFFLKLFGDISELILRTIKNFDFASQIKDDLEKSFIFILFLCDMSYQIIPIQVPYIPQVMIWWYKNKK